VRFSDWEIHEADKNKTPGGDLVFASAVTANRRGCVRDSGRVRKRNRYHMGHRYFEKVARARRAGVGSP
jgi:hypothetical protein